MTHPTPRIEQLPVNGVRLQTFDWGGEGPAVVFLAGYANTPHVFAHMVGSFLDRFRVVGLSRRAHGTSEQPKNGYDVEILSGDIVAFLDARGIERASFVGHSFAGYEMCELATVHPDRVGKLVFLDALYRYEEGDAALFAESPLPTPDPPPETFESLDAYCADFVARYPAYRRLRSPRWDAIWAHGLERTDDGRLRERIRPETARQLYEGRAAYRPDYAAIRCPVQSLHAFQDESWSLPDDADEALRTAMKTYNDRVNAEFKMRCVQEARDDIADVGIVELHGASHYCFFDREAEVVEAVLRFL